MPSSEPSSAPSSQPSYDPDCELCLAHRLTPWLHEDDECWIAECMVCDTPMVVWRPHGLPDEATAERLVEKLRSVADEVLGEGWWLDGRRRNIPDHWHAHARPAGGFFGLTR